MMTTFVYKHIIYGISPYNFEFKSNLIVGIYFLSSDLGKLPSSSGKLVGFGLKRQEAMV